MLIIFILEIHLYLQTQFYGPKRCGNAGEMKAQSPEP